MRAQAPQAPLPLVLSLLWLLAACGDGATHEVADTVDAEDTATAQGDADTATPEDTAASAGDTDADADPDTECPADRVPRVVDGVVVDPCGRCAIGGEYCHGLMIGGSPYNGMCPNVQDAVPPCTSGRDENGCETLNCSGSCLDPPDTQQGEPDAG